MASPPQKGEEVALNGIPDHTDDPHDVPYQVITSSGHAAHPCARDQDHRKLAICSIICGLSCIGIAALINSVKAGTARKEGHSVRAQQYSEKACKLAVVSIVVWLSILVLSPALLALFSYLLTLID